MSPYIIFGKSVVYGKSPEAWNDFSACKYVFTQIVFYSVEHAFGKYILAT